MKTILCWFGKHEPFFGSVAPIEVKDALGNKLWRLDPCLRCKQMVVTFFG